MKKPWIAALLGGLGLLALLVWLSWPRSGPPNHIRITIPADTADFNVGSASFSRVGGYLKGSLLRRDSRDRESSGAATSVSPDRERPGAWLITLREDARFHDGSPVSREDVVASIDAAAAKGMESTLSESF